MDSAIKRLVMIDKKARDLVEDTKREADKRERRIRDDKVAAESALDSKTKERVDGIRETYEREAARQLAALGDEQNRALARMEAIYNEKKEMLTDAIVKRTVGDVLYGRQ